MGIPDYLTCLLRNLYLALYAVASAGDPVYIVTELMPKGTHKAHRRDEKCKGHLERRKVYG